MNMENFYVWTLYWLYIAELGYIAGEIFGYKYNGRYRYLVRMIELTITMILVCCCRLYWPTPNAVRIILTNFIACCYYILPCKGAFKKRLMVALTYVVVGTVIIELATYGVLAMVGIYRDEYWYGSSAYYAISIYHMMFYIALMFVVWFIYNRKKWFKHSYLFLLFPVYQTILLVVFLLSDLRSGAVVMLIGWLTVIFEIALDMSIIWFVNGNMKKLEVEEKLTTLYNQRQYELDYYRSMNRRIEEIRSIRHDFMNQVQTAYVLLQKQETAADDLVLCHAALKDLTDKVNRVLKEYKQGSYCENPVLDAILALKAEAAGERGIRMEIDCELGKIARLSEMEICSLFGNLLDNAIEGCEKVAQGEKWIKLLVREESAKISVYCENTSCIPVSLRDENKLWTSRKKEKENHGIGLKVIEKICSKYNGKLDKNIQQGIVCVSVDI